MGDLRCVVWSRLDVNWCGSCILPRTCMRLDVFGSVIKGRDEKNGRGELVVW